MFKTFLQDFFAFTYCPPEFTREQKSSFPRSGKEISGKIQPLHEDVFDGWKVFSMDRELSRLGLPNKEWRVIDLNNNYDYSPTYPTKVTSISFYNFVFRL